MTLCRDCVQLKALQAETEEQLFSFIASVDDPWQRLIYIWAVVSRYVRDCGRYSRLSGHAAQRD